MNKQTGKKKNPFFNNNKEMESVSIFIISKWLTKMWHIYTMEFYSVIEMNEIGKYTGKTMKLESTILRKVTEAQ